MMPFDPTKPINQSRYMKYPALKAADIAPATAIVVTVSKVLEVPRPDTDRPQLALLMAEHPDFAFYLNAGGIGTLCDKLGEVPGRWVGKQVPLWVNPEVYNPSEGKHGPALQVAPLDRFDDYLKKHGATAKARKAG